MAEVKFADLNVFYVSRFIVFYVFKKSFSSLLHLKIVGYIEDPPQHKSSFPNLKLYILRLLFCFHVLGAYGYVFMLQMQM